MRTLNQSQPSEKKDLEKNTFTPILSVIVLGLAIVFATSIKEKLFEYVIIPEVVMQQGEAWFNEGKMPDALTRLATDALVQERLTAYYSMSVSEQQDDFMSFVTALKASPVAIQEKSANEQHYEVDSRFYHMVLGKRLKYSSALYSSLDVPVKYADALLNEAEERMLKVYTERANLDVDGSLRILDMVRESTMTMKGAPHPPAIGPFFRSICVRFEVYILYTNTCVYVCIRDAAGEASVSTSQRSILGIKSALFLIAQPRSNGSTSKLGDGVSLT